MATFQITGPDGKKYRVSGENAEGALQALQSHLGSPQDGSQPQIQAAPSPQMQQGMGELSAFTQNPNQANADRAQFDALPGWKKPLVAGADIARLAATGLTGGLVNAAAAGVRAPFTDKTYSEELAALTAADDRARNRAGSAGLTAEIGSSVLGLGKLTGAGMTTGRLLPQGAGLLGRTGASVADSLLINEAMNAGYGRDFGENAGLAAGMGAAAPAAGQLISGIGSKALGMFNKAPPTMDADALKQAAQAAYNQADQAGAVYTQQAVQRVAGNLKNEFANFGYHPELQSGAKVALGEIDRLGQGNVTLKGLDTARKIAGNAYQPMNKANNALTAKVASAIDDLVENPQAGDVLMGDATKAGAAIKEARDLYGRSAKLEKVQYLLGKAGLNAGSAGSGGNIENATRQQLKTLLTNPKNTRGFTADEKAALTKAVLGSPAQNGLRLAGKLSPQGNGLMMAIQALAAGATGGATVPLAVVGMGAKAGAESMTRANVKQLERLIASGGKASAMQAAKTGAQKAIESKRDLIAKLLLAGGLSALPAN